MKYLLSLVLCLVSHQMVYAKSAAQKGHAVAKKVEKFNNGFKGDTSEMEMILINANGDKVTRKLESKVKEMKKDGDKGLMTFLWPADVKGTKMLTWAHKDQNDDQWIYLPALKRVKRITSSSKTGSFMGSEFSYEDLGSQEVEKYTYKLLKETTYKKRKVWILERVPKDKDSGYSRQVVWIDKKYMGPVRIEYFDRKNEKLKTAVFTKFKKIKRWWRSLNVEIENHQTKKKSIMIWKNLKLGVNLNPRDFDKDNLK